MTWMATGGQVKANTYHELTPPIDRSTTFGDYTTLIDDTAAFPGEKVAGYVLGEDPLGTRFGWRIRFG